MIYCETNYEHNTRVTVQAVTAGYILVTFIDLDSTLTIGTRRYDVSCEREAVAYAKKLIAGEVAKGDSVTL